MRQYLALPLNLILKQEEYAETNVYLWLSYWRYNLDYLSFNVDKEFGDKEVTILSYSKKDKTNTYKALGISRQTWWAQGGNKFPSIWLIRGEGFTSFLSFDVFDRLLEWLNTKTTKSREPYLRLYCYVYFNDIFFFHHFQRSQEQMAIDLGMARSWLCNALNELIAAGFIERKGKYKFTGDQIFSYIHGIPDEDRTDARKM